MTSDTEGILRRLSSYIAPTSNKVLNIACRDHSRLYYNYVFKGTATWATRMWDATAKLNTGLLSGNLNSLGNFDECLDVQNIHSQRGNFGAQYCLVSVSLNNITAGDAMGSLLKNVLEEEEEINIGLGNLMSRGLRWGVCIPDSCTPEDLEVDMVNYIGADSGVGISVRPFDCSVHEEKPYSTVDWIAMTIWSILLLAVCLCTGYEYLQGRRKRRAQQPQPNPVQQPVDAPVNPQPNPEQPAEDPQQRVKELPRGTEYSDYFEWNQRPPSPLSRKGNLRGDNLESPTKYPKEQDLDIFNAFSLISNCNKIFSFDNSKMLLTSVDGIKFLSLCWIVLGHAFYITETLPALNYITIFEYSKEWTSVIILNSQLAVDTFILCTGVLTTYNFFNDMKWKGIQRYPVSGRVARGSAAWFLRYFPRYYLHRYIRLAPALAAMVLLQMSLLNHIGSGPFWATGNGILRQTCEDSWWGTLLFVQNYISGDKICLPHSWYVMVDLQLYLLSPLFLLMFLYWKQWKATMTAVYCVILGSQTSTFVNYFLDLPAAMNRGGVEKWHLKTKYDYVAAWTRFSPWMVGMIVGFLLHHYRYKERVEPAVNKHYVRVGWVLSFACMSFAVFGLAPFRTGYQGYPVYRAFYSGYSHTFWAVGLAWLIFACETHHGGLVHDFLSQKVFQPLRRLIYCTYLVHLPLMTHRALLTRVPIYINKAAGITAFFGDLLFSIQLAIVLSLMVELPFMRLYKAICLYYKCPFRTVPEDFEPQHITEIRSMLKDFRIANIFGERNGYHNIPEDNQEGQNVAPVDGNTAGPSAAQG